jgi:hypothetical protein
MTADEKFEMLIAALTQKASDGISKDDLRQILVDTQTVTAKAMQKVMRPENETHPGISAFSHPEGDRAKPKPALPFQLFWNYYPVHKFPESESWVEWEQYAQLKPGEFTVVRNDGTPMKVSVTGEKDADGKLTKVEVKFPISRMEKNLVPPRYVLAYQLIHEGEPRKLFKTAWMQWLDADGL